MDQIRPIGPPERDIDPVYRVERAHDESEGRQPEQRKKKPHEEPPPEAEQQGPVEGDDGHLHVDIRA
jgi:hypothetical protein